MEVVESGRIQPCRAIDLGCGTASNAIFLARHGFDVTGTDYPPAAIALLGAAAGVMVKWVEDDLTDLQHVTGVFDFVDWGVYDDLSRIDRRAYMRNMLRLTHARASSCSTPRVAARWYDRLIRRLLHYGPMKPGEIEADFGPYFQIEKIMEHCCGSGYLAGEAAYWLRRRTTA